jgi:hypothetical protein
MKTSALVLLILWIAGTSCSAQTLVIGLYDYSGLSIKQTTRLTETIGLVFAHSGFHVVWRHCVGALAVLPRTTCMSEMQVNEIAVNLEAERPRSSHSWTPAMGHAIVTERGGHYTRVFVPAVWAQAGKLGVGFERLLAYTVAHEAGHCLLGPGHSYTGLMRSVWNRKDADEMSRLSLHLTKQEDRKAVARLTLAQPAAQR